METELLSRIHEDLDFIKKKVVIIDNELEDISSDLHKIKPEYLKKLEMIKKGKFHSFKTKEDFLHFLENEMPRVQG